MNENTDWNEVIHGDWSVPESPLGTCGICQRSQPLSFHATSADIVDRAQCRTTSDAETGIWLCSMCEDAVHRWMNEHPGPGSADRSVNAMFVRLSNALFAPPRRYRRKKQ